MQQVVHGLVRTVTPVKDDADETAYGNLCERVFRLHDGAHFFKFMILELNAERDRLLCGNFVNRLTSPAILLFLPLLFMGHQER
jgi:hypothetical protein